MFRIGHGYDVHRLVEGRRLILGGVDIPFERGLLGHSDADVLVHAIMDAILGAAALGDIGKLFPDTDERYAGADSLELLGEVMRALREAGYELGNVDSTVIAQRPKPSGGCRSITDKRKGHDGGKTRLHRRGRGHRRPRRGADTYARSVGLSKAGALHRMF